MSERAIEDAYFYRLDRELIAELHAAKLQVKQPAQKGSISPPKKRSLYDIIDEQLQPNEHWLASL